MESRNGHKQWISRRFVAGVLLFILSTALIYILMRDKLFYAISLVTGYAASTPISALGGLDTAGYDGMPRLRFKADGGFKIGILEDLHFGEGEDNPPELGWGPISDQKSVGVIKTVLDAEEPDLVVLNGDLITGENTQFENATEYLDLIVDPLVSRNIPFASTYGNHDQQFNLSSHRLLQRERHVYGDLSYTRSMISNPQAGVSNYVLPIYSSGNEHEPALLIWCFDSKGGSKFREKRPGKTADEQRVPIPGYVDPSVVNWFLQTNAQFVQHYGRHIPSIAFVHIPIFAMAAFQATGVDPNRSPGINDDNPLSPQAVTDGKYTGHDQAFMKALVDTTGLKAVFSGHDHGVDWCFDWRSRLPDMTVQPTGQGLFACFGRHTGYGGYGSWKRGSRQVLVYEDTIEHEIKTWVRLEDRSISGSVVLNSTYGFDVYPKADNSKTYR